jgi:hypothetical protein
MYKDGFDLPASCLDLSTNFGFEAVTTFAGRRVWSLIA